MKAKHITFPINILVTFLLLSVLSSCGGFLDEDPRDALYEHQAFKDMESLRRNALLNVYNYIGGSEDSQGLQGTAKGVYDLNSLTTDEQIIPIRGGDWYDGGLWVRLFMHAWTAGEGPFKDTWDYLYKVVMLCNEGIENVTNYQKSCESEADMVQPYIYELRAIRAMYYFYLMDLYGRVPIVTDVHTKSRDMVLSPRSETFRFIIKELQEVEPFLSDENSSVEGSEYYGRVTKSVVWFLLAKLCLNAEIYSDDNWTDDVRPNGKNIFFTVDGMKKNAWESVAYYCYKLSFTHSLELLYQNCFKVNNVNTVENIFTIPMNPLVYSNVYNYFYRSRHYSHGAALGGASENGACATVTTIKTFGYGTNKPDYRMLVNFYVDEVRENNVPVFEDDGSTPLVYHPLAVTDINLTGTTYEKTAGARLRKYAFDATARADGRMSNNDIVLFRYSDVLLMWAEAEIRNGGDGSEYLNSVRERSFQNPISNPTLDDVYRERLLELVWEGWRRNDMIRFDRFHQPYDIRVMVAGESNRYTIVFPIPSDIIAMHPGWKQNKGY